MVFVKLNHDKEIIGLGKLTVGDFWSWAYSNIFGNINRSVFAEFLVGSALGVIDNPRNEWDSFDLRYQDKKIEVKSASYLQDWYQNNPSTSRITFGIGKKKPWSRETNIMGREAVRSADCYVFCLYIKKDKEKLQNSPESILDVNAWQFFVLSTEQINQKFKNQKTVGLKRIETLCKPINFDKLKECINFVLCL